ncbi:MAG TPA: PaaI family thioesterase [Usitatibacteraceae bacterium]|nr:PaaI family thioesterase [Usitatibacteraceae bacterium]
MSKAPPFVPATEHEGTGLDYLRRMVAGEIASVPIGDTLGFRAIDVEHGRIVIAGTPDRRSYNLIGTVHGGWAASILDSAMALATLSSLDEHHLFTTLDIKINYVRGMTAETGEVRAEGRVLNAGRRVILSESKLTDSAGKLLATGQSTCLVIPRKAKAS